MQEIFFTILVVWILFRILNSSSERKIINVFYQKPQQQPDQKEGDVKITFNRQEKKKENPSSEKDYVDFEEIK